MTETVFIITIDTEGDNLWARPARVTTENARFLPRFQALCERHGFPPTYLVNYEMALDPAFQAFGHKVVREGGGEVGLHVHPWYSPPGAERFDPAAPHQYLYELPDDLIAAKVGALTDLLARTFEVRPVSHRAGKWGFDERVARVLVDHGYLVDCSVTPGLSWRRIPGGPNGRGGPDFTGFPLVPYMLDLDDVRRPGVSSLLEVPVTVRPTYAPLLERMHARVREGLAGAALRKVLGPPYVWLRPNGRNLDTLLALVEWGVAQRLPALEFMLHSSELMPGGSPTFHTAGAIDVLYTHLGRLFGRLASLGVKGATLARFRRGWAGTEAAQPSRERGERGSSGREVHA